MNGRHQGTGDGSGVGGVNSSRAVGALSRASLRHVVTSCIGSGLGLSRTSPAPGTVTVAYNQDIAPILRADCQRCHSGSRPDAGYSVDSYALTMREVRAGDARSRLVTSTQNRGSMYRYWSGNAANKAPPPVTNQTSLPFQIGPMALRKMRVRWQLKKSSWMHTAKI